jgi:baculoviral IAP repeat-containing protein 7/8
MAQSTSRNLLFREVGYTPTTSTKFGLSRVGHMGSVRARVPADFQTVNARAETFRGWNGDLSASDMYEAGFIYRNLRDQVQCVYCTIVIEGWKWYHSAILEHRSHSPSCSFVVENAANMIMDNGRAGLFMNPSVTIEPTLESSSEWNSELTLDEETTEPSTNGEEESSNNEEATSSATDTSLCKICYINEMCILFLPCAHLLSCSSCAKRVRFCALCREPIQQTIRAFISFS